MSKLCQNDFCLECIKFCQKELENERIPDLIEFGCKMGRKFGELIEESEDKTKLYFAPAGNYPPAPKLVVCGLATSPQAKDHLKDCGQENCKEMCRRKCLESVYRGNMLYRLALILRFFFYDNQNQKLTWSPLEKFELKSGSKSFNFLTFCRELPKNKSTWHVVQLPEEIQFTQILCCLTKGDATFSGEWFELAKNCLTDGYLKALIGLWRAQKIKTIIFLGRRADQRYPLYKYLENEFGIKLMPLYNGWYAREGNSYLLFVDHPSSRNKCFPEKWLSSFGLERDNRASLFDSMVSQYYSKLRCNFIRPAFSE